MEIIVLLHEILVMSIVKQTLVEIEKVSGGQFLIFLSLSFLINSANLTIKMYVFSLG